MQENKSVKPALHGVKVLDLTRVLAGPWCSQLLGDLGADVVKVEQPRGGDDSRQLGAALPDSEGPGRDSAFFLGTNRNKRGIAVDLAQPAGAALVRKLAVEADVFVENFKAGGLRKYGLDHETLRALNPRLIYCSLTGFGQDGPYAARPAYDFIMQAMAGLMSTCGQPDGTPGAAPTRTAIPTTDLVAGYNAAVAILGALIQRYSTGQGQFIDAAMLDATVGFNVHIALGFLMSGQVPYRQGNSNPIASPSDVFRTQDGWMVIAAGNDRQFANLCQAIDSPSLVEDPRFASNPLRVQNRSALSAALELALTRQPAAHWLRVLEQHQVPCAPINGMDMVFEDPQVRHRDMVKTVTHGSGKDIPLIRSTLNMSASPAPHIAPPQLGQHTREVLREWLQHDTDAVEQLCREGAILQR